MKSLDFGNAETRFVFDESRFQQDFFQLFEMPSRFAIDIPALDQRYRDLQSQVHPDKFSHLSESEQRLSMQWSTRINEGYQTLRSPLARGRYLLSLQGVDTQEETNTAMPLDFLMQQMEWREALQDAIEAKDIDALDGLSDKNKKETKILQHQLGMQLDESHDHLAAAGSVRKLRFLEKLAEEISSAYDELDS
ncbi:MAG: Fe-S protein assembly co-chaperone HscB [Sideroxydans sp.]|nr:Fe-S protein assembly co-chaperone HscB [Sideroxydans sp.]